MDRKAAALRQKAEAERTKTAADDAKKAEKKLKDQEERIQRLKAEAERAEAKLRRKAKKEEEKKAKALKAERKKRLVTDRAFWSVGIFGSVSDDGSVLEDTWEDFWYRNVTEYRRQRQPNKNSDYSPNVIQEANRLLNEGVSDRTEEVLEMAQYKEDKAVYNRELKFAKKLRHVLNRPLFVAEGIPSHLCLRFRRKHTGSQDKSTDPVQVSQASLFESQDGLSSVVLPLVLVAAMNKVLYVREMIKRADEQMQTHAMIEASRRGHHKVVDCFVKHGKVQTHSIGYALGEAATMGYVDTVGVIVTQCWPDHLKGIVHGPWYKASACGSGVIENAAHGAIRRNDVEIMKLLLKYCEFGGMMEVRRCLRKSLELEDSAITQAILFKYPDMLHELEAMSLDSAQDVGRRRLRFAVWQSLPQLQGQQFGVPVFHNLNMMELIPEANCATNMLVSKPDPNCG